MAKSPKAFIQGKQSGPTAGKGRPALSGSPITIEFRPSLRVVNRRLESGEGNGHQVHAAAFLRQRRIVLDSKLGDDPALLNRILIHELAHFAWVRLGNPTRLAFERLLEAEWKGKVRGELGLSSGWRKDELRHRDVAGRTRKWREYTCESFCDTVAWFWNPAKPVGIHYLGPPERRARASWLRANGIGETLPV